MELSSVARFSTVSKNDTPLSVLNPIFYQIVSSKFYVVCIRILCFAYYDYTVCILYLIRNCKYRRIFKYSGIVVLIARYTIPVRGANCHDMEGVRIT